MGIIFFIPKGNHKIQTNDLDKGCLRITRENKQLFPDENDEVLIHYGDKSKTCRFQLKDDGKGRSSLLHIGKDVIEELDIKISDVLECEKVGDKEFNLTK